MKLHALLTLLITMTATNTILACSCDSYPIDPVEAIVQHMNGDESAGQVSEGDVELERSFPSITDRISYKRMGGSCFGLDPVGNPIFLCARKVKQIYQVRTSTGCMRVKVVTTRHRSRVRRLPTDC